MRVIVTGGRDFDDWVCMFRVLDLLLGNCAAPTLVHGSAPGADAIADQWARERNASAGCVQGWCGIERFPADWKKRGKAAGPIRNSEMVAAGADMVIAFPGDRGTADCVSKAKTAGILVLEVTPARNGGQ